MPDSGSGTEAEHLARRIEELIIATHGHALVLFTSYSLMGEVHTHLQNRLPFPLLEAWRNGHQAVRLFKNLSNAVLFAAGPCWEGMDFPGDMVSLLVIARLPFPVPDPVSEAERKQYPGLRKYIHTVVLPDMQSMLANSELLVMLNQAATDREELAKLLNISENQLSYITNVPAGHGLIRCGGAIIPFENSFPKNTKLYQLMTTKPNEKF